MITIIGNLTKKWSKYRLDRVVIWSKLLGLGIIAATIYSHEKQAVMTK